MKKIILLIINIVFVPSISFGSIFTELYTSQSNFNDELDKDSHFLHISNQAENPYWNFPLENKKKISYGVQLKNEDYKTNSKINYTAKNYNFFISKHLNEKNYFKLTAETWELKGNSNKQEHQLINFQYLYQLGNGKVLEVYYDQSPVFSFSPKQLNLDAKFDRKIGAVKFTQNSSKLRLNSSIKKGKYSDGNDHQSFDISLAAPFLKQKVEWFWLGYKLEHLENKFITNDYWSPRRNQSHSIYLDISQSFSKNNLWKISSSINYGQSKENDLDFSDAKSIYLQLSYGERGKLEAKLSYQKFEGSTWKENTSLLQLHKTF